jgi:L-alanine-DL-glutamate epimerase-like enolase superfamily enzyme
MKDRPAVFLRVEDGDGAFGFGEVWCNFPGCGAEHRARLVSEELAELVFVLDAGEPGDLFGGLSTRTRVRALQTGEAGPYAQTIAALDIAAWDMAARRANKPVRMLLSESAGDQVMAYASGIHIGDARSAIAESREQGFRNFKVKVGFALDEDAGNLNALAGQLPEGERLFADANQAWELGDAIEFVRRVGDAPIGWLEEPMPADTPLEEWQRLAGVSQIPLAAGENIASEAGFQQAIGSGSLEYIQPDIAKWGGFTGCFSVARSITAAGAVYCPHYLGGGIGLAASAELLAAAGGEGLLEIDVNPNPLREAFFEEAIVTDTGRFALNGHVGLGVDGLPDTLDAYKVAHVTVAA